MPSRTDSGATGVDEPHAFCRCEDETAHQLQLAGSEARCSASSYVRLGALSINESDSSLEAPDGPLVPCICRDRGGTDRTGAAQVEKVTYRSPRLLCVLRALCLLGGRQQFITEDAESTEKRGRSPRSLTRCATCRLLTHVRERSGGCAEIGTGGRH